MSFMSRKSWFFALSLLTAIAPAFDAQAKWDVPAGPANKALSCSAIGSIPSQQGSIRSQGTSLVTSVCLSALENGARALTVEFGFEYTELWKIIATRDLGNHTYRVSIEYLGSFTQNGFQNYPTSSKYAEAVIVLDQGGNIFQINGNFPGHAQFIAKNFKNISQKRSSQ